MSLSFLGILGLPRWLSGREPACSAGLTGDSGSSPGSGRSPGGGHGNPLQHSFLESSTDRGAWRATVHRVAQGLKQLSTHAHKGNTNTYFLGCSEAVCKNRTLDAALAALPQPQAARGWSLPTWREHQRVNEKSEGGGVCVCVCVRARVHVHISAVLEMEGRKQLCVWEGARRRMGRKPASSRFLC